MDTNDSPTMGQCPVVHGAHSPTKLGTTSSRDWWPNQLNLKMLHQRSPRSNPRGAGFRYAEAFKTLDLEALKKQFESANNIALQEEIGWNDRVFNIDKKLTEFVPARRQKNPSCWGPYP